MASFFDYNSIPVWLLLLLGIGGVVAVFILFGVYKVIRARVKQRGS